MTQWHRVFARLLRLLVEGHYEVRTNVPVGDAPRSADILLLRRTWATAPPFQGLWRWLMNLNVLEIKGPTVSARVAEPSGRSFCTWHERKSRPSPWTCAA